MTDTGKTVTLEGNDASIELPVMTDTFNFTVPSADKIKPEQAHLASTKYTKDFSFAQVTSNDEAETVSKVKGWTLVDFVNDALKGNARASAYQTETLLYKPSEVSADDIKERMIKDYVRLGIPAETARAQVEALLSASK